MSQIDFDAGYNFMIVRKSRIPMRVPVWSLFQLLVIFLPGYSKGTHFHGAQFWFRPSPLVPNRVELDFRILWRMNYRPVTNCNQSVINSGQLIGPETPGYLLCTSGCKAANDPNDVRVGDLAVRCIDYSTVENWMCGSRAYNYTFPANSTVFVVSWYGDGWFYQDTYWQFVMTINTSIRSDIGRMNSSPRALLPTSQLDLQVGCNVAVNIPVADDDNDIVRCRWAVNSECGGVCHDLIIPSAQLNQALCTVNLGAFGQSAGGYVIAVQLEDFSRTDTAFGSPLSSVPVQLGVFLFSASTAPCDQPPVFIAPTPSQNQTIQMMDDNQNFNIYARTKDPYTVLSKMLLTTQLTPRITISDLVSVNTSDYYMVLSWNSSNLNGDIQQFCFVAQDNFGYSSNPRCFFLRAKDLTTTTPRTTTLSSSSLPTPSLTTTVSTTTSTTPAAPTAQSSTSSSWDYRWLIVIVVGSVGLFVIAVLLVALVMRVSRSRSEARRKRQERYFNTLNAKGIYNWAYNL